MGTTYFVPKVAVQMDEVCPTSADIVDGEVSAQFLAALPNDVNSTVWEAVTTTRSYR